MELGLKDKNCILEKGEQNEEMDDVSDMKWKWNLWTVDGGGEIHHCHAVTAGLVNRWRGSVDFL